MSDYNKYDDDLQMISDDDPSDSDASDLIVIEDKPTVSNSKKIFTHPVLTFDDSTEETNFNEKDFLRSCFHIEKVITYSTILVHLSGQR